jgi:predicted nucleic acid-binding protein
MEAPCLGIILDSSVVIEAERQHLHVEQFLKQIAQKVGNAEVALCSITIAELAHGVYRADTADRRQRRRAFLDALKAAVPVYAISDSTAELVGQIGAESAAGGLTVPFRRLTDRRLRHRTRVRNSNQEPAAFPKDPGLGFNLAVSASSSRKLQARNALRFTNIPLSPTPAHPTPAVTYNRRSFRALPAESGAGQLVGF